MFVLVDWSGSLAWPAASSGAVGKPRRQPPCLGDDLDGTTHVRAFAYCPLAALRGHVLRGFPVDGRRLSSLRGSAWSDSHLERRRFGNGHRKQYGDPGQRRRDHDFRRRPDSYPAGRPGHLLCQWRGGGTRQLPFRHRRDHHDGDADRPGPAEFARLEHHFRPAAEFAGVIERLPGRQPGPFAGRHREHACDRAGRDAADPDRARVGRAGLGQGRNAQQQCRGHVGQPWPAGRPDHRRPVRTRGRVGHQPDLSGRL